MHRRRPGAAGVALAFVVTFAVAACQSAVTISNAPLDTGTPVDTGAAGDTDTPASEVKIDSSLLAVLPRSVDSISLIEDDDGDDQIRGDDVLPTFATAAVSAVASDATTSNLAFGYVVKLRPGVFTDAIFHDWRDTFDAGACSGEDQVVGNASDTVGSNTVYIGTCANGLRTYHTWLKDRGILLSFWSTGEKKLGLVILGNLRK
jgi:hypothetical protein